MDFLELARQRFSAKYFGGREISRSDLEYILEAGRQTPSSFGLEPWKFVAFTNDADRERLTSICLQQKNVATASAIIAIMGMNELCDSFITRQVARFGLDEAKTEKMARHIASRFKDKQDIFTYTSRQCYLACMQMTLAAKYIGIDSCIIGGFNSQELDSLVGLYGFGSVLVLALGYADENARHSKHRLESTEVIEIR